MVSIRTCHLDPGKSRGRDLNRLWWS